MTSNLKTQMSPRKTKPEKINLGETDLGSNDIEAIFDRASDLHDRGQLQEAERLYKQVLKLCPDHSDSLHLLGVLMHQIGHTDLARSFIESAIRFDSQNADYRFNLGEILRLSEKSEEAVPHYLKAIEIAPWEGDYYFSLGNSYIDIKQYDEAIDIFRKGLGKSAYDVEMHQSLARALQAKSSHSLARIHYLEATIYSSGQPSALVDLAKFYADQQEWQQAAHYYAKILNKQSRLPRVQYQYGLVLERLGETEKAKAAYETAVSLAPNLQVASDRLKEISGGEVKQ